MFVNFCSKLAFMKFNRLTHKITKNDTLSRTAARESLPKCFQLFQTALEQTELLQLFKIVALNRAMEPGYRPVLAGCLPLKCYFSIFFQKTSFFVVFWVSVCQLSAVFYQTHCSSWIRLSVSALSVNW